MPWQKSAQGSPAEVAAAAGRWKQEWQRERGDDHPQANEPPHTRFDDVATVVRSFEAQFDGAANAVTTLCQRYAAAPRISIEASGTCSAPDGSGQLFVSFRLD